ncbi:MAG: hypothetical protein CBB60_009905 [Armatimonadetes bacterium Cent15-Ar3]|nr:MAG: hypothetical protein CBB60_009905 [Armatimonadetes bacterium Cent15-Ar3]
MILQSWSVAKTIAKGKLSIMQRLEQLTGWRFVASFSVVVCHAWLAMFPGGGGPMQRALGGLGNFVDFFFILSGFVLSYTYRDRLQSGVTTYRSFLTARVARIYPGVIFSLLVAFPAYLFLNRPLLTSWAETRGLIFHGLASVLLIKTWLPFVDWRTFAVSWNGPLWSIETEFFFYLMFPFLSGAIARGSKRARLLLAPTVLLLLCGIAFSSDLISTVHSGARSVGLFQLLQSSPYVRCLSFILGIGLYEITLCLPESAKMGLSKFSIPLLGCSIGAYFFVNSNLSQFAASYGLPSLIFSLWILLAAYECRPTAFLGSKYFVYLGELSFSIYLLHIPLMRLFTIAAKGASNHYGNAILLQRISVLLSVVVTLLLAAWTYKTVEQPFRMRIRQLAERNAH